MTYGNVLKVEDVMKEEELEKKNKAKKQIPLRVSPALYAELMEWAKNKFRFASLPRCMQNSWSGRKMISARSTGRSSIFSPSV